jgi:mono/diheme cytochrome c family protein
MSTVAWLRLVAGACCLSVVLSAQQTKTVKKVAITPPASSNGEDLFLHYCAVCHGKDARGGGPAASALKKAPADLTQITRRNNGKFPELRVQNVINGEDVLAAHGSRDMPTWGEALRSLQATGQTGGTSELRIYALIKYLESIQAK